MKSARAPGKIILSGEHSVVYGAPALVAAVNRFTRIRFTPIHQSRTIRTALKGISGGKSYRLSALARLRAKLDHRFEQYSRGERAVQHILNRPDDLVIYSLATLLQHLPMFALSEHRRLPVFGKLSSDSDLPLGAGMGSSAAAIAATLVLYEEILQRHLTPLERFQRVRFCERLQHGAGSAIDAAATVYGGLQELKNGEPTPLQSALYGNWYWVLSGIPIVSTGECVAFVRQHFGKDADLWAQFAAVTEKLKAALVNVDDPRTAIMENNQLLQRIGVTPQPAANLIAQIEKRGGAAKISGAGAHRGEGGGIVLAYHPEKDVLPALFAQLDVSWDYLTVAEYGAELEYYPEDER